MNQPVRMWMPLMAAAALGAAHFPDGMTIRRTGPRSTAQLDANPKPPKKTPKVRRGASRKSKAKRRAKR